MTSLFPDLPPPSGWTRQVLGENEWVSLMIVRNPAAGVDGYVYSHETRCGGRIVAVLPWRDTPAGREYLVKSEMTPCWGPGQVLSAITGGWEGGDIRDDAVRELLEETGYEITRDELVPLGESFASKSADTVYSLFTTDLTGREAGEPLGDGTRVEAESAAIWVSPADLPAMRDPQIAVMYLRLRRAAVDDVIRGAGARAVPAGAVRDAEAPAGVPAPEGTAEPQNGLQGRAEALPPGPRGAPELRPGSPLADAYDAWCLDYGQDADLDHDAELHAFRVAWAEGRRQLADELRARIPQFLEAYIPARELNAVLRELAGES